MAIQSAYKKFKRGQRLANVETDFTNGMMYSEGAVSEGYVKTLVNFDFTQDGRNALKPRAALTTCEFIVPDMDADMYAAEDQTDANNYTDDDTVIKYSKECVENGEDYRQFILGKPTLIGDEFTNTGKIWLLTSKKTLKEFESVRIADSAMAPTSSDCAFYGTSLTSIHDKELTDDAKTAFPVGAFMGNSFYFFDAPSGGALKKTVFNTDRYVFTDVDVQVPTASEAVNYGYNMLYDKPYIFDDTTGGSSELEMQGILPYDAQFASGNEPQLMMTPKANTRVWFRCNYDLPSGASYKIVWSWKEVSGTDDWTIFNEDSLSLPNPYDADSDNRGLQYLQASLIVPAKEILIRCEAYNVSEPDAVERAMTVGFDFTISNESTTANTKQEEYDLSSATGMISWKNRLVLWGVPKDPTILFISDLDEPGYFPYPNNVTIFDEPIIAAVEHMDNLVVFTKSKVHQVSLNTDGYTWTSTVIQSNLYIEPWDKHLIQAVRNMLYFKSGNYYYMIVPKAQSTTGELTLAPITTPITDFFNHFSVNVEKIFRDCFKTLDDEGELVTHIPTDLITYYNFLDYEFIHNFYVYKYQNKFVHFDIVYNVVDRYWKICIYESGHYLFPFRNDATQQGLLAGTSNMQVDDLENQTVIDRKAIQLFKFDPLSVEDIYVVAQTHLMYRPSHEGTEVVDENLNLTHIATYDPVTENLTIDPSYVRASELANENLWMIDSSDFTGGFSNAEIYDSLAISAIELRKSTLFPNKQMLDTGYRDANLFINKRYRELQLQINNPDNVDMEFGMDFQIAGEPRNTDFLYEVSQTINEMREDEGIVYIDATPYVSVPYKKDNAVVINKRNVWTLKHYDSTLESKVSIWKVRAAVSGKGMAPRLRLFTKAQFNYQLLGMNWIYREMNMR